MKSLKEVGIILTKGLPLEMCHDQLVLNPSRLADGSVNQFFGTLGGDRGQNLPCELLGRLLQRCVFSVLN